MSGKKRARGVPVRIDPGRTASPEEVARWTVEIGDFLNMVFQNNLNVHGAARHARSLMSDEAIAFLAFRAHALFKSAEMSARARRPRTKSVEAQMRKLAVGSIADLKARYPAEYERFRKDDSVTDSALKHAISKAKNRHS